MPTLTPEEVAATFRQAKKKQTDDDMVPADRTPVRKAINDAPAIVHPDTLRPSTPFYIAKLAKCAINKASGAGGEAAFEMQLARAAIVIEPVGDVAVLLDLDQTDPGSDRVDRSCRDVEKVAGLDRMPGHQRLNLAVDCGAAHLARTGGEHAEHQDAFTLEGRGDRHASEGEIDDQQHRGVSDGWRFHKLPWVQD